MAKTWVLGVGKRGTGEEVVIGHLRGAGCLVVPVQTVGARARRDASLAAEYQGAGAARVVEGGRVLREAGHPAGIGAWPAAWAIGDTGEVDERTGENPRTVASDPREPPRLSWRLRSLRGWSHDESHEVPARAA